MLYLVKREVMATSLERAIREKGKIYSIELAADNVQPFNLKPIKGFSKIKKDEL